MRVDVGEPVHDAERVVEPVPVCVFVSVFDGVIVSVGVSVLVGELVDVSEGVNADVGVCEADAGLLLVRVDDPESVRVAVAV